MNIISASRRTDIPHYFTDWFKERRKAGFAEYRTVFGGGKNGRFHVSLKPEDVLGYLFWTKFAGPFHEQLETLRGEGVPYVFHYTLTCYGKEIQPGIPERAPVIAVPEWHQEELAARELSLLEGKERFSDWESAKDAIRGSLK